jgi:hypothetical protein
MATQEPGSPRTLSERRVRKEARKIFDQLEKGLDAWYTFLGLLMFAALAGIGPYCWFQLDMPWWKAGAWGIGGTFAMVVAGGIAVTIVEHSKATRAARRFNLRFPEDTQRREWAVGFLSDFTPTNDGSKQFLSDVLPASLSGRLLDPSSGITEVAYPTEPEEALPKQSDPAPRRRARRRSPRPRAIPVDHSRDPDALIPLELPPDVQRKQRE